MKEYILNYLLEQENLGFGQQVINMGVALIIALVIYGVYALTYTGVSYSRKFNISLVMLTLVTTMVMTVIANNIALSLGMVGALSIVRFRTAIKDSRDTTFIFWAIAVGICCGVGFFQAAAVGTAVIVAFLLLAGHIREEGKYLLVIRCKRNVQKEVEGIVYRYYQNISLRVKNTTGNDLEYIYELSMRAMKKAEKDAKSSIMDELYNVVGVHMVNLIAQTDDMSR